MGLFFAEDPQLLPTRFGRWWKTNLLTLAGFAPLTAGISYAVLSSSVLVLIPCSLLGGMIAGPFLAGMYDAVLRGLRDDPKPWWDCYQQAWKQNWKGSLVPGALLGGWLRVCTRLWRCCSGGRIGLRRWGRWSCNCSPCWWCWL